MTRQTLTLTITGDVQYGPSWDALQTLIRGMVNDDEGVLTRIARRDAGANYRAKSGTYDLTFRTKADELPVVVRINERTAS